MFQKLISLLTKKGKRALAISAFFFLFYGLSSIAMIIVVFSLLFKITAGEDISNLYIYFAILIALVIFKGICNMVADLKKHEAGFDIVQQIREKMIIKLKLFSLGFYTNERLGEINTILHKDVDNMSMVVGHVWSRMFGDFLIATVVFIGLSFVNIRLAVAMLLSVPIALIFLYMSIQKSERIEKENNIDLVDMVSLFVEYVRGIPLLKSFSNNKSLDYELENRIHHFGKTSKETSAFKAKQLSIFAFLLDLAYIILILIAGLMTVYGNISVLTFMIIAVISKEFYKPFASMEMHYMYYISAIDSYERLSKIFFAEVIADNKEGEIPKKNDIIFENVEFFYEEEKFRIKNLSFKVKEKTMTALVGESGSGKTTITNLLLRFYELSRGKITIGGVDIREIPYDDLLDKISIVMQNVQLFDTTIEENIRVGKKGASMEEIIKACKKARIHDYIMSLPKQYKTNIGENGGLLSGGQRQRISIARSFLKDAPILILDEMTSNVDPVNESLIQDAISELSKDRTILVIAHHLKTIKQADQILVFRKGHLLEIGNHNQLLKKQAYYSKLWQAQYGI